MKLCAQCGNKLGKKDRFCIKCGCPAGNDNVAVSRMKYCLYCGEALEQKAKFCSKCGKSCDGSVSLSFLDTKKEEPAPANVDLDFLKTPEQLAAERAQAAAKKVEEEKQKAIEEAFDSGSAVMVKDIIDVPNSRTLIINGAINKKFDQPEETPINRDMGENLLYKAPETNVEPQPVQEIQEEHKVSEAVEQESEEEKAAKAKEAEWEEKLRKEEEEKKAREAKIKAAKQERIRKDMERRKKEEEERMRAAKEEEAELKRLEAEKAAQLAEEKAKLEEERKAKEEERKAQEAKEAEAVKKAEEERLKKEEAERKEAEKRKAEEERIAKEEAEKKAEEERIAKEEAEKKAAEEKKAEEERLKKEEEERKAKEEEERKKREEEERLRKEEEERRRKEEEERLKKEEEERKKREEEERKKREEEERLRKEEEERRRKEEEERLRKEEEERKKREEEERKRREEEEKRRKEEEEKRRKEEAARKKALQDRHKDARTYAEQTIKKFADNEWAGRSNYEIAVDKINSLRHDADADMDISDLDPLYNKIIEPLGIMYYEEGAHKLANPLIAKAAENGSKRAMVYQAQWYVRNRSSMPKEPEFLVNYMDEAISSKELRENEKVLAYEIIAKIYHDGISTKRDLDKAFMFYQKGAEMESPKAIAKVGQCYMYGEGVRKDPKKAFEFSQKAAELDNETGIRNLAVCYDLGTGVKRSAEDAIKWYKKLLEVIANDRFAMYRIANCLADPDREYRVNPSESDYKEAMEYALKACEGGEENANYIVGYLYMIGEGCKKDYNLAVSYFTKAANYGNSRAKKKLEKFDRNSGGNYVLK